MAEANKVLDTDRLLTLAGPGGSGKTRLALAVASGVIGRFPDGGWLVELASLSDPDLVPQVVASLVGVRETPGDPLVETLAEHLMSRRSLLVLDNCEHLIDVYASLAEALLRELSDQQATTRVLIFLALAAWDSGNVGRALPCPESSVTYMQSPCAAAAWASPC